VKRDGLPGNEPDDAQAIRRWLKEELMAHAGDAAISACPDAPAEEGATRGRTAETLYRTVDPNGFLVISGKKFYIDVSFAGKCIAFRRLGGSEIELFFQGKKLGRIDVLSGILEFERAQRQ